MRVEFQLYKENQKYNKRFLYDFETYIIEFKCISEELKDYLYNNYKSVIRPIHGKFYEIKFMNFVGWVNLFQCTYEIRSKKWNKTQIDRLWLKVSQQLSDLPYQYFNQVKQRKEMSYKDFQQSKYHQWVLLRDYLLYKEELVSGWEQILRDPHTQIITEHHFIDSWKVQKINEQSLVDIVSYGRNIALSKGNPLEKTLLSQKLSKTKHNYIFPLQIRENTKQISYDNRENRFIKWILTELYELTVWMDNYITRARTQRSIYRIDHIIEDNNHLQVKLREMLTVPWLAEVGMLSSSIGNSTVLQRKQGYRQWFAFYQRYIQGYCYPLETKELQDIIEAKKVSEMFEYYCFFEVLESIERVFDVSKAKITFDNSAYSGSTIRNGTKVTYNINGKSLIVYYNKTFQKERQSYSIQLRPDISILYRDQWIHLDSKFKNTLDEDFIAEDINKMHVYRDAIYNTRAAVVLYPVVEAEQHSIFFNHSLLYKHGVGAISIDVHQENTQLAKWINDMLKKE